MLREIAAVPAPTVRVGHASGSRVTVNSLYRRLIGPRTLIAALVGLSLIALALPSHTTDWIGRPVQLMAPFHSAATRLFGLVAADSDPTSDADDPANRDGQHESAGFRHQVATQQARIRALEDQNADLRGYRDRGLSGGRLISVRVIGRDSLAWRHSILLDEGLRRGVRTGQKVITSHFVDVGRAQGVDVGMSVLAGEALLGEVVEASSRAARVRLLGDVESRMAVVVARVTENDVEVLDAQFWMTGSQDGRMIIQDVYYDKFLDDGLIRVGDLVLTDGSGGNLPISVVVGTVVQMDQQHQNRLLYNLVVEPAVAPESVQQAYVVNMAESVTP